jgi:membrane protease YdiL (CAAX protease family)
MALQGDLANLLKPQVVADYFAGSSFFQGAVKVVQLGAIVLSVWLAGRLLDCRRLASFGLHLNRNWWLDLGFGLFLGALLMLLIFLVEWGAGWVTITGTFVSYYSGFAFPVAILAPLILFIFVGLQEELLSRGYQLQNIAEGLNGLLGPRGAVVAATLLSSAVFGLLHIGNAHASLVSTVNLILAGAVLLAMGRLLTGELAIPIGVHITWNFFQGNVFGLPVSGTTTIAATVLAIEQSGPALWTGGAFGPEAGLLGIAGILLGGILTILWVHWRYGQVRLKLALARPPESVRNGKSNMAVGPARRRTVRYF